MYQLRPLSELKKYESNPRTITERDMAKLIQSLRDNPKHFTARPLILSDRTGELVILSGNQRYEAAKFLEMEKVPTFLLQGLTEVQEREILVRENVNNGDWNYEELYNSFNLSELADWGLDLSFPEESAEDPEQNDIVSTTIKLEYTLEDYERVKNYLALIDSSPEQAVWKLCGFN